MHKIIFAVLASVVALITPNTASAQSLEDVLGVVSVGTQLGFNPCGFTQGSSRTFCQVNRAANVASTIAQIDRNRRWRRNEEFNQRAQQIEALQRACRAGDEISCNRSGGANPQQVEIARALAAACSAGDKVSCRRARDMMSERGLAAANQGRRAPMLETEPVDQYARRPARTLPCTPQTGYMVNGIFHCPENSEPQN